MKMFPPLFKDIKGDICIQNHSHVRVNSLTNGTHQTQEEEIEAHLPQWKGLSYRNVFFTFIQTKTHRMKGIMTFIDTHGCWVKKAWEIKEYFLSWTFKRKESAET